MKFLKLPKFIRRRRKSKVTIQGEGSKVKISFKDMSLERMTVYSLEFCVAVAKQLQITPESFLLKLLDWNSDLVKAEKKDTRESKKKSLSRKKRKKNKKNKK